MQTGLSQMHLLQKECPPPLHVVSIAKTNRRPPARAPVVLGSSDLGLAYTPRVDYAGLRCPIECNWRDAHQYWGLEDFMNVTPPGGPNAAHLALFMVHVAYRLRADVHPPDPDYRVLDLQADCRGST